MAARTTTARATLTVFVTSGVLFFETMNKDSKAMDIIQTILKQFKEDQNSEYADISDYDFALDRIYEVVTETGRTV